MSTTIAELALSKVSEPFDAAIEFTVGDACKARGWSPRRAQRALSQEVRDGRLSYRVVVDGMRRYYAYRIAEEKK